MFAFDTEIWLCIAALLTSALAAIIGQGGGMILMAIMAPVIPASMLVPFHGAVQLASNASRAYFSRALIQAQYLLPIIAGMIVGSLIAVPLIDLINGAPLLILAGTFILYSTWRSIRLLSSATRFNLGFLGLLQGHLGILVGATGPLGNALLRNLGMNTQRIIATNAVIMSCSHILKIIAFTLIGVSLWDAWPTLLALACASVIGSKAGTLLRGKIPSERLALLFKWALTLLSLNMIRLGIVQWQ